MQNIHVCNSIESSRAVVVACQPELEAQPDKITTGWTRARKAKGWYLPQARMSNWRAGLRRDGGSELHLMVGMPVLLLPLALLS